MNIDVGKQLIELGLALTGNERVLILIKKPHPDGKGGMMHSKAGNLTDHTEILGILHYALNCEVSLSNDYLLRQKYGMDNISDQGLDMSPSANQIDSVIRRHNNLPPRIPQKAEERLPLPDPIIPVKSKKAKPKKKK